MRVIKKYKFVKVFDLQNSSRTNFYKRILFPNANHIIWSSSDTTLPKDISKKEFDKNPVLDRFKHQLETSGIKTNNVMKPDFNWACQNIDEIKHKYKLNKYIILFPFCSPHLAIKKWPHYNKFIDMVKNKFKDEYQIVVAPGPLEIPMTKDINAVSILNHEKADDWTVSTGFTFSVRDLCEHTFKKLGLDYKDYVVINPKFLRPLELPYLKGDSTRIRNELGWSPKYSFETTIDEMIDHWLKIYDNEKLS